MDDPAQVMPTDKTQMLLDLLHGWASYVDDLSFDPEAPDYPEGYSEAVADLYVRIPNEVETGEGELTPREWLERHLLPLFGD
jgi:hypothetical protein